MRLGPVINHLPGRPGYRETLAVTVFGSPTDIERLDVLFTSLLLQAANVIKHHMPPGAGSAYKQSWLNGYGWSVAGRVREAEKQAAYEYDTEHALTGQHSAALVLATWEEQVMAYRKQLFPNLGKPKTRNGSGNGYSAGYVAGQKADLGRPGVGAARGRELASA
jgi:hypothetical protein